MDKEKATFKDGLLRQGVPAEEIQKVYRSLREKGYGEEEAKKRSRAAVERMKSLREMERRRAALAPQGSEAPAASAREVPASSASEIELGKRAVDWLPTIPQWLRRRINRYAYRNGYLITRLPQRFDDFMSRFDQSRPDLVSRALLALLADERGFRTGNPFHLSFIDTLDALRESAGRLMGQRGGGAPSRKAELVLAELRAREPFAVEYFSVFTQPYDMLRKSLEYLGTDLRTRAPVRVSDLARVVKDGCRLIAITDSVEQEKLVLLYNIARDVNLKITPGPRTAGEMLEAEGLFRACLQNLGRFAHELYPALLKMIAAFYTEEDSTPMKTAAVRQFLGIQDGDILTWEGWQRRMRELREKELQERQARELARLEQEKVEKFSVRFEGTLSMLASLFPESGVERIEQGEFVLPYFSNRIFRHSPVFEARAVELESMSAQDIMGLVLVFHSLLDDMLSSLDPAALERLVAREGLHADLVALRDEWRDAFPRVFEPYLDAVREYARETAGDPRYAAQFKESQRARTIAERINQLRNTAIRGFGHIITERVHVEGPKLYELASRLSTLLTEAGMVLNQNALGAGDPVSRKVMMDLAAKGIVDFVAAAKPGTVDYHPVTRQVRRWIEARFRETVLAIPQKAQVTFLDVFRGVAYLYDALLNDQRSPAALAGHGVVNAASGEHALWNKERAVGARDAQLSLQETLGEQFPGQYLDALTGLKNKDYFLKELPRKLQRLRGSRTPLSLMMIDIDHFKWVNDSLGHSRGDEVLKATAAMILDNIREGDLAVRYGGEEMLIVVPSDMHTGIILAERLRFSQETKVLAREGMQDVRKVGKDGGQPCSTLSIGVADIGGIPDLQKAVEKADRALYAAKRSRNLVVFIDKGGAFISYADYRRRAAVG
ncbi:MAG: GGDEF domain-containing protein [Spirochaetia bacterium]|jgi:diguanylate cyclase (GGDEF)-like protein